MSAAALTWCWQQHPRTPTQKLVLAALADRADDDGFCYPSLAWLAKKCKPASVQSCKRAVADLEQAALLAKVSRRRRGDGTLGTWLYRLPLDQESPMTPGEQADEFAAATDNTTSHERPVGQGSPATEPQVTGEPAETTIEPSTSNVSTGVETRRDLVAHFVDEVRRVSGRDPLSTAKARIGKHVSELRKAGVVDDVIAAALTEVAEAGLMVGAVLAVADQIHRGGYRGRQGRPAGGMSAAEIARMATEGAV